MGKIRLNKLIESMSGSLGDIVLQEVDGQVYYHRKTKSAKPRTEGQKMQNGRFGEAGRFAKAVLQDPVLRGMYQAACHGHLNARNVAIQDYFSSPEIRAVDLSSYTGKGGQTVRIEAMDLIPLKSVQTRIQDSNGLLLEEGAAERDSATGDWVYTTQLEVEPVKTVQVEVTAEDCPGNRTSSSRWHFIPQG